MKQFDGFPARMEFTSIPNLFFSRLLPQIEDMAELMVTLHIFRLLYQKKGYPRYTAFSELLNDTSLIKSICRKAEPPEQVLKEALDKAIERGTFIHVISGGTENDEEIYLLNTAKDREVVSQLVNGEITLPGLKGRVKTTGMTMEPQPNIFSLYEQNIGMLTPIIADELREAEKLYPEEWIKDAIKEAVNQNKRNWRYIVAILERWNTEGKSDGTHRRHTKKADADKFRKQSYGHMVKG